MIGAYRAGAALAVLIGLFTVAAAQQSPPGKQAKPATSESKPAPAKKGNTQANSAVVPPAPGGGAPALLGQFGKGGA